MRAMTRITGVRTLDVRARTSLTLAGSDAVHQDPDYSGAYCFLETDGPYEGVGMTFTIGRGNDLCCAAIEALAPLAFSQWPPDRCPLCRAGVPLEKLPTAG